MRAFDDDGQKIQRLRLPESGRLHAPHFVKQAVEMLPHLRTDLLAHLARVFPRRRDAAGDHPQSVGLGTGERIAVLGDGARMAQAAQHAQPAAVRRARVLLQHQVQLDAEHTRGMFGALQVAAHPIQAVGDSREHIQEFRIQKSEFRRSGLRFWIPPAFCSSDILTSPLQAPTYPCCLRLATNSPPAIPSATPRASIRRAR